MNRHDNSTTLHPWVRLSENCNKSTAKITVWDVNGVILEGSPNDRHHVSEAIIGAKGFLGDEIIHLHELTKANRQKLKRYLAKRRLPPMAALRLMTRSSMYALYRRASTLAVLVRA